MDPRRLIPALAAVAACCVVVTLAVTAWRSAPPSTDDELSPLMPAASGPASILADWDERRSTSWSDGDIEALRDLYTKGSRAGAADVRLLRRYADRGLRVTGLRTQVLALRVVTDNGELLRLEVTDRVVGGRAVGAVEGKRLPADRATTRRIDLVKVGEDWLVDEVRDQASAASSTSRTSSSSKS